MSIPTLAGRTFRSRHDTLQSVIADRRPAPITSGRGRPHCPFEGREPNDVEPLRDRSRCLGRGSGGSVAASGAEHPEVAADLDLTDLIDEVRSMGAVGRARAGQSAGASLLLHLAEMALATGAAPSGLAQHRRRAARSGGADPRRQSEPPPLACPQPWPRPGASAGARALRRRQGSTWSPFPKPTFHDQAV